MGWPHAHRDVEVREDPVALLGVQAQDGLPDDLQRQQVELLLHVHCGGGERRRERRGRCAAGKCEVEFIGEVADARPTACHV